MQKSLHLLYRNPPLLSVNIAFYAIEQTLNIKGAYEISECILMCAVFASFAYGQTEKMHIHMTLLIAKIPGRIKLVIYFLGGVLSSFVSVITTWAMLFQANRQFATKAFTGLLHIPYYPFYYLSFICFAAFTVTLIFDTLIAFTAIFKKEYADELTANW